MNAEGYTVSFRGDGMSWNRMTVMPEHHLVWFGFCFWFFGGRGFETHPLCSRTSEVLGTQRGLETSQFWGPQQGQKHVRPLPGSTAPQKVLRDQIDTTARRTFALQVADPGSIPGIP